MILALRAIFAAATIALVCLGGYYLIERNRAREAPAVESTDASVESRRDVRKKARAASKLAVAEGCTGLSADYQVWEDYLDKKTRRKLKALVEKCNDEAEAQVSAEP